ncbi:MAG: LEA type 2 family protein [Deltaproteobacteria bacterium]|nr:LEA type 2 family protein [Deltaproteobacteria bacterium]
MKLQEKHKASPGSEEVVEQFEEGREADEHFSRRQVVKSAGSAALLMSLSGCKMGLGALRKVLKDPQVRILGMKVNDASLDVLNVDFDTEVKNPNRFPIFLKDIDYALDVEKRRVADGKTKNGIELAANGSSKVVFPMRFLLADSAEILQEIWKKTEVDYTLEAGFHFGIKGASVRIPVAYPGKAPVPKLPVVEVRSVRMLSLGPTGLKGRVKARVKNPNSFALPLNALDVKLYLKDELSLNSRPLKATSIAAGRSKTVEVDFHIDLLRLGMSLADLVLQQSLPWTLKWDLTSGQFPLPIEHEGVLSLR